MKIIIRSALLASCASLCFSAPWGGGRVGYNPMGGGILMGNNNNGPFSPQNFPPFYNPGPGNLSPAFSYTQPSLFNGATAQNTRSALTQESKNAIGKWKLRVSQFRDNPEGITDSKQNIDKDRDILTQNLKMQGLGPQESNAIGQIMVLLDLAEIRSLIKLLSTAETSFQQSYQALTNNIPIDPRNTTLKSRDWYINKNQRLRELVAKFQRFLSQNPQFAQSPPDLLVGLGTTLNNSNNAINQYTRYSDCMLNPATDGCNILATSSRVNNRTNQSFGGTYSGDFSNQYDDNASDVGSDDGF
ncbi:MAG: hypothetical protein ACK5PQ_01080 [Alphaproteobacteria bacterium]